MAPRAFTVFQDVPTAQVVRAKPVTSTVMMTRSSVHSNIPQESLTINGPIPVDKENVHPVTGERAGMTTASKKRKTNVLTVKPPTLSTSKKVKSLKDTKAAQPQSKIRKASSGATNNKGTMKKDGKTSGPSRKITKAVTRKLSKLPQVEEEGTVKHPEPERMAQASIDSRCYELTVKPLADISQAYEAVRSTRDASSSPRSKAKFHKETSVEHDIRDFLSSSQTLTSLPSASTTRAPSSEPVESRKFSTPERKQIYAAFTFSSPSPASERFKCQSSNSTSPSGLA